MTPMIPFIIYGSYKMGALLMGANAMKIDFSRSITLNSIKNNMVQYIYGSITLAIVAGILLGLLTFIFLKLMGKRSTVITKAE